MKRRFILMLIFIIAFTILSISIFPNVAVAKEVYMTADIWTSKGGQGQGTTGGVYKVGEQVILYVKFTYCDCAATLTISGPGGTSSTKLSLIRDKTQAIPLGIADQSDIGVWQAQLVPVNCVCGGPNRTDAVAFSVTGTVTPTPPPTITIPPPVTQPPTIQPVTPSTPSTPSAPTSPPATTPPASTTTTPPVKSGSIPITIDTSTPNELKALLALKIADGKLNSDSKLDTDKNGKVDMADAIRFLKLAVKKQ